MRGSMAPRVDTIPLGAPIVNPEDGTCTAFFRLREDGMQRAVAVVPVLGGQALVTPQAGSIAATTLWTTRVAGLYQLSAYIRKTTPGGGGSSSVQLTWGWVDHGTPLTDAEPARTVNSAT